MTNRRSDPMVSFKIVLKRPIALLEALLVVSAMCSCVSKPTTYTSHPLWAWSWGGRGDDFASGVAVDSSGNIYVVGDVTGKVRPDGNGIDSEDTGLSGDKPLSTFLSKFDSSGKCLWTEVGLVDGTCRSIRKSQLHPTVALLWPEHSMAQPISTPVPALRCSRLKPIRLSSRSSLATEISCGQKHGAISTRQLWELL